MTETIEKKIKDRKRLKYHNTLDMERFVSKINSKAMQFFGSLP